MGKISLRLIDLFFYRLLFMKTLLLTLLVLWTVPIPAAIPAISSMPVQAESQANATVFRVWPKRVIRSNGQVITPDQPITVTVPGNPYTPFVNGAKEVKAELLRAYGFDYKKAACTPNDFNFKKLS